MAIAVTAADKIGHRAKPTGGNPPTGRKLKAGLVSRIRKTYQKSKNTEPNTSQAMVAGAMVIAFAAAGILLASEQSATQGTTKLAARNVINDSENTLGLVPPAPPPARSRVQTASAVTPPNFTPADLGPAVGNAIAVSASEKIADLELPIQISEMQRLLAKLDFRPGPPDGVLGHRTVGAIRLYQKFGGLEITGHATPELLSDLRAVADSMPEPSS
ncbi:MAG: peptidoglycan-binding protein [Rhodospirillales bacterium]|nr:peptidoglycan-binding protein [Rhodospirillales bacterium]